MNYLLTNEETSRLKFRRLEPSDFSEWLPFFEDPLWNKYWAMKKKTPIEHCHEWMNKIFNRYENNLGGMNVLGNKTSGEFIGQCGLLVQTVDEIEGLEVAYSILPRHRGKGYAPEAAKRCIEFAFENKLSESVISIIHKDNVESQRVAMKNGLTLEKRTVYDNNPVLIYRIRSLVL